MSLPLTLTPRIRLGKFFGRQTNGVYKRYGVTRISPPAPNLNRAYTLVYSIHTIIVCCVCTTTSIWLFTSQRFLAWRETRNNMVWLDCGDGIGSKYCCYSTRFSSLVFVSNNCDYTKRFKHAETKQRYTERNWYTFLTYSIAYMPSCT